jgi:hypothetical protein
VFFKVVIIGDVAAVEHTTSAFYPDDGGNRYSETFVFIRLHGVLISTYCCENIKFVRRHF